MYAWKRCSTTGNIPAIRADWCHVDMSEASRAAIKACPLFEVDPPERWSLHNCWFNSPLHRSIRKGMVPIDEAEFLRLYRLNIIPLYVVRESIHLSVQTFRTTAHATSVSLFFGLGSARLLWVMYMGDTCKLLTEVDVGSRDSRGWGAKDCSDTQKWR